MSNPEGASLAQRAGLVRTSTDGRPEDRVADAERRLRALLDEVNALDLELEALSAALEVFAREHDHRLAASYAKVERAERWVRRLQKLQDELHRLLVALRTGPSEETAGSGPGRRRRKPATSGRRAAAREDAHEADEDAADAEDTAWADAHLEDADAEAVEVDLEDEARVLKRLYRRLARVLHPDLARDEAERLRLTRLMAEVNAAYERGDRTALELMAEKVGAGEPLEATLTDEERLAFLEKRIAALNEAKRSLIAERGRLRDTATGRLHAEAQRRAQHGRDYFAEMEQELADEEVHAVADGWARFVALHVAAAALGAERSKQMAANITRGDKGRTLRPFDPVLESPLVRRGAERLERHKVSAEARTLARELEAALETKPWEVALTLLAYFAELAERPPDTLRNPDAWRERYDALRARWSEAPPLDRLLVTLPGQLEPGLRHQKGQLRFGVQLRSLELLGGVAIALERAPLAALAREVLLELGPHEKCKGCGEDVAFVHVLRTHGLDELHALVCPRCFHVQRRYWLYAPTEGLEALLPSQKKLGLVVEQIVRFGGASVAFQCVAEERRQLTAGKLLGRIWECYFAPYKIDVPREALQLVRGKKVLGDEERVPTGLVALRFARGTAAKERDVLELLRSRIERRFRPDA